MLFLMLYYTVLQHIVFPFETMTSPPNANAIVQQTKRDEPRNKLIHFRHDSAGDTYEDCKEKSFSFNLQNNTQVTGALY